MSLIAQIYNFTYTHMKKKILSLFIVAATLFGCDVTQEFTGAYNMLNCEYKYQSLTGFSVAGIDISRGLSLTDIPKVTAVFSSNAKSIPLNFTVNVDVKNPHRSAALLHGLDYILSVDGIQFSKGSVTQSLSIPGGGTQTLPVNVGTDLAVLMKGKSKDAVIDIVKNMTGVNSKQSNVTVQIRPTFMVSKKQVTAPNYIPISFSFGGRQ